MTTDVASQLLHGKLGTALPPLRSRVVRIFTSSTFTDTSVERNALMRDIYPKLKDFCKSKYGLEFQVVDMRWGVRDEATDDHMTSELCMNEIAACQKLSIGPNFVTFLCQKYGYRPFPPNIPADELEAMRQVLVDNGESVSILDDWFIKDTNSVPPVYRLQPISSKLVHFNDNANPDKMGADRGKWWDIFETLQKQLRHASSVCQKNKQFNEKQAAKFKISVTHDEVKHGILDAPGNKEDHCVCFIRKFGDLEKRSEDNEAKNFIDINWEDKQIDGDAKALLTDLRDQKVPKCLKPSNLVVSTLSNWSDKGIDVTIPEHKKYLEDFLKKFYDIITSMIERMVEKDKTHISHNPLYEEILQHLTFCKVKCETFHGREDLLGTIRSYLQERLNGTASASSPMVIHGESGSGKTSVMAKAAFQTASEWFGHSNSAVVVRFLGTTPASTGVRQLLRSVCRQVLTAYGYGDEALPDDYFKVVRWFQQCFRYASKAKPLIIFLDSLDQLSAAEGAHRMAWLPRNLPPYAALVVSTLPKEHGILDTLQVILNPGITRFAEVKQLSLDDSKKIMRTWLESEKKTVTSDQMAIISNAIQQCSLPLFLKLLFDRASRWQSYLHTSEIHVKPSIKGMISLIFDRLEEYHGKMLVSRALGYITISQNGIAEAELEDLLSLDDEVLQDVYAYWLPPIRRIPPLLWTRIRSEINDYLVEREAEGARVIYWYHRQFIETSRERYLNDPKVVAKLHTLCAEYYTGKWSGGTKKPFQYTKEQMKKFNKQQQDDKEDRKVAPQPLEFGSGDRFNIRKLEQLPFHLIYSGQLDTLKEDCLCNFQFLLAKLRGLNLAEVLQDFTMALEKYEDDEDIRLVSDTLRVGASALRDNPYNMIVEIIGRLKDSTRPHIKRLVTQTEESTDKEVPLVPYNQCFPPPGGLLRTQLMGHNEAVLSLATTSDGRFLISGSADKTAIVWELDSSTLLHTLKGKHEAPISSVTITPDNLLAITYCYQAEKDDDQSSEINVWNIETGDYFLSLGGHTGKGSKKMQITSDSKFAVSDMYSERVEGSTYVRKFFFRVWSLDNGRELYPPVEAHSDFITGIVLARSKEGRHLVVTSGDKEDATIKIWDLLTGKLVHEVRDRRKQHKYECTSLGVSSNGRWIGMNFYQHGILDVYNGEFFDLSKEQCHQPETITFLNDDKEILYDNTTHYDIASKKLLREMYYGGSYNGRISKLFIVGDFQLMVSWGKDIETGAVWRPPKKRSDDNDDDDTCVFLGRLRHNKTINDMCVVDQSPSFYAITGSDDKSIKVWNVKSLSVKKSEKTNDESDDDASEESDESDHYDDDENETYAERYPYLRRIVHRVQLLDNEKRVALIDNMGKHISLYDVEKGALIKTTPWDGRYNHDLGGLDSTPDGQRLFAVGGYDLWEYDTKTLEPLTDESKELDSHCTGLLLSKDGSTTLLLGGDRYIDDIYFYDINKEWYLKEYDPDSRVSNIFFLSGDRVLIPGTNSLTLLKIKPEVSEIYNHSFSPRGDGDYINVSAITKDEQKLITGYEDGFIKLFDVSTGTEQVKIKAHDITLSRYGGDEDAVTQIELSSKDQFFVTASSDKTARVWDMASLRQIHVLKGHNTTVMSSKITGDDRYVLTAAKSDISVKVWSVSTGQQLANILGYSPIDVVCILPKTNRVIITTADARFMFFKTTSSGDVSLQAGNAVRRQLPPPGPQKQQQGIQQSQNQMVPSPSIPGYGHQAPQLYQHQQAPIPGGTHQPPQQQALIPGGTHQPSQQQAKKSKSCDIL